LGSTICNTQSPCEHQNCKSSAVLFLLLIIACDSVTPPNNRIVIGISADVQTFNPLFAFSYEESAITIALSAYWF
jgi:hypothetical protein